MIELSSPSLRAVVDPARGADVLSLVHRESGTEVLFQMPASDTAAELAGVERARSASDSQTRWLANYRGGWQTLVPVAGAAREIYGALVGFHGEASVSSWNLDRATATEVDLSLELDSIPISIVRRISLSNDRIEVADELTNRTAGPLTFDYAAHPALGGDLLDGRCVITAAAREFTFDPDTPSELAAPGSVSGWPDGGVDAHQNVAVIPARDSPRAMLGWLGKLEAGWATIENLDTGMRATVDWDASELPYAWIWQELESSEGFPWFRHARTVAIEPASCPSGGPRRQSVLTLAAGETRRIAVGITVISQRDIAAGVSRR
jgi:galactose mutarotase-like enzyme